MINYITADPCDKCGKSITDMPPTYTTFATFSEECGDFIFINRDKYDVLFNDEKVLILRRK